MDSVTILGEVECDGFYSGLGGIGYMEKLMGDFEEVLALDGVNTHEGIFWIAEGDLSLIYDKIIIKHKGVD